MTTAKQRAWRAKFARLYGGKKKRSTRRSVKVMARRRSFRYYAGRARRSYRRSGGIMGLIKPFLAGAVAGALKPSLPLVNQLPQGGAGAVGGYVVKRSVTGAAIGAAGELVGTPFISQFIGGGSSTSNGNW